MMKRLLLICLAMMAVMSANAEVVNADKALVLARSFISQGNAKFKAGPGIALKLAHEAHSLDGKPDYYVFNNGDDGGFIVVTGDDRTVPVWGYSTSGSFDYESMPANAKWWFSEYQRQLQYLRDHPEAKSRQPITLTSSVAPLLTTKWDQTYPYNLYCPMAHDHINLIYYNDRACTGCVATALAQIMNYHKWPNVGKGSQSYEAVIREYRSHGSNVEHNRTEQLSVDFSKSEYKWSQMKDEYGAVKDSNGNIYMRYRNGNGDWTVYTGVPMNFEPIKSVAKLIKDVGYAVKMNYGSENRGGSSSNYAKAEFAMENFFSYKANTKRRWGDDENWDESLRAELAAGKPIYYRADESSSAIEGGHAFVIEGYNNQGEFYINWGWGGDFNGYYYTSLLNPDVYDFNHGQLAIFLTPKNGKYSIEDQPVKSLSVAMESGNAGKIKKGGVLASIPFTIYGVDLDHIVTITLSGSDADQFYLPLESVPASEANSGRTCHVCYYPTTIGTHTAKLTVSSGSDVDPVTLLLTGHAVIAYDANGDQVVNIHDVTAMIQALLTDEAVAYTDKSIYIKDVTDLINALLTNTKEIDVNNGLVAYYPFDGDASDASGHGNDGVLNNVTLTTGTYGEDNGACQFGGYYNPSYIQIPNSESLKFTDGFSFACFVKPTAWYGHDTTKTFVSTNAVQAIFAKSNDQNGPSLQFAGDQSKIKFYSSSLEQHTQWCGLHSQDRIQGDKLNTWVHVAVTYSDRVARMYIDGELVSQKNITPDFSAMNLRDMYLGCYSNSWYPFCGVMDEVRVYNRALTPYEVVALAEGTEQGYAENHPFALSLHSVKLAAGESVTIDLLNGSGSYSVGSDSEIVDFTLDHENECLTFTGITEGNTNVTVIDVNSQTTIQLPVTVTAQQDNHEYVDLGLPSGTLWATMNIGASAPEEYGDYFAWGETEPRGKLRRYSWCHYKWCYNCNYWTLTKYCTDSMDGYNGFTDGKTELDPEDDAAYVNWGPSWRMPSSEQQQELIDNCTWSWTTRNGVNGYLVTGPNGNTIFMPAAGNRYDDYYNPGYHCRYWSRTLSPDYSADACSLYFSLSSGDTDGCSVDYRCYGLTVRAVRISQN